MKFTTQVEEPVQIRPLWLSWLGMWCEATGLLPKQHIAMSVAGKLSLDDTTERLARDGQKFLTSALFLHRLVRAPGKRAFGVKLGRETSLAQPLSQCRIFLCISLYIPYILRDFFLDQGICSWSSLSHCSHWVRKPYYCHPQRTDELNGY